MEPDLAREAVINAGKKLLETGLIARTWGNVSCRIDNESFAITPSGMLYDSLRPSDIVIVNISDLHYDGTIKPSSEKGIHAEVYKQKPGISFVIHTHQVNASVAGVLGKSVDITGEKSRRLIGEKVTLASYGLPGTAKLRKNIAEALKETKSKAVLMANHGALCFGADSEEAFLVAQMLESECERYITVIPKELYRSLYNSRRTGEKCVFENQGIMFTADIKTGKGMDGGAIPPEAELHCAIYRARADIRVINGSARSHIVDASKKTKKIRPLLDDFAQILGTYIGTVGWDGKSADAKEILQALKGRSAVLLRGKGALNCAGNEGDAAAMEMILEKGCKAYLSAVANGGGSPISPAECVLMRYVYLLKYAKKAKRRP